MSRPTGRVLTLLELLQSGGTRTMAELADRLGVDGRTVRRYVEQLVDLEVPVEAVRGRYGGYRLAPGYRLPPLMLSDEEAIAVLLGLTAGRRTGLTTAAATASETAAAKIRRVLPQRLARRLEAVLESLAFTQPPGEFEAPDAGVLLTVADAVRHRRPVSIRYTDREGRRSERALHPYGVVAHAGRWYVTGQDPGLGQERTFRLDRVADARALPGCFEAPTGPDPAQRVLSGFATADYRHRVSLRIHASVDQVRARFPASVASVRDLAPAEDPAPDADPGPVLDSGVERWLRVDLRAERLDWLPPLLAGLDRPFAIDCPAELRVLVQSFAARLSARAHSHSPVADPQVEQVEAEPPDGADGDPCTGPAHPV